MFTATTTLVVSAPPRVILEPMFQVVRPGQDAAITCTTSGDQPITIEWSKEGQPYLPRSVYADLGRGRLEFRAISAEDQGRYTCMASNPLGVSEGTAEVIVSSDEYSFNSAEEITARLGSTVELYCR